MCTLRPVTVSTKEAVDDIRSWLHGEESEQDYGELFDFTNLLFDLLALWQMTGLVE